MNGHLLYHHRHIICWMRMNVSYACTRLVRRSWIEIIAIIADTADTDVRTLWEIMNQNVDSITRRVRLHCGPNCLESGVAASVVCLEADPHPPPGRRQRHRRGRETLPEDDGRRTAPVPYLHYDRVHNYVRCLYRSHGVCLNKMQSKMSL